MTNWQWELAIPRKMPIFNFGLLLMFVGVSIPILAPYLLWPYLPNNDRFLDLLVGFAVAAPLIVGAYWSVFPEFFRLEDSVDREAKAPKWIMRAGLVVAFGVTLGVGAIDNIAFQLFHLTSRSEVRFWIEMVSSTTGIAALAVAAILSRKRWPYNLQHTRPIRSRRSLPNITIVLSPLTSFIGILVARSYALPGLILLIAGSIAYPTGLLIRRKTQKPINQSPWRTPMILDFGRTAYEEKLAIARQISDLIVHEYGRVIRAVCLWGSSAGADWSYPELEILAVIRDVDWIPSKEYVYQGLTISIHYWPESTLLRNAREIDRDWPSDMGYLKNRVILFERNGWLRRLDQSIQKNEAADPTEAIRATLWKLVKYLSFIRNDVSRADSLETKADCGSVASWATTLVYLLNRRYSKDYWYQEVFDCPIQPKDFRRLIGLTTGYVPGSQEEMVNAAETLCKELFEMVMDRGISAESSKLLV